MLSRSVVQVQDFAAWLNSSSMWPRPAVPWIRLTLSSDIRPAKWLRRFAGVASRLLAAAEHRRCLQSCGADGTSVQMSLVMQTHLPAARFIRIASKASHEFHAAANFVRRLSTDGEVVTAVGSRDPLPHTSGKGHLATFAASRSKSGSVCRLGHRGPVVQHESSTEYVFEAMCRRRPQ